MYMFYFLPPSTDVHKVIEILKSGVLYTGDNGIELYSPIRKWLVEYNDISLSSLPFSFNKDNNERTIEGKMILTNLAIGIKLEQLKKSYGCRWIAVDDEKDLLKLAVPPQSYINLSNYQDAVCLCPNKNLRDSLFVDGYKVLSNGKRYPNWHWRCVTRDEILSYNRNDEELQSFLTTKFDSRNHCEYTPRTTSLF